MTPRGGGKVLWKKIVSVSLAILFISLVVATMIILLVLGEDKVSDSFLNFLYLSTPIALASWKGWDWISSVKVERIEDEDDG
ncbi:hypothetical protein [Glutamicibacter sp. NPDC087344]|uniref:hypothetical protein n=1 Tax=Glutamicibacter sp. NPDC087344 TaxID=3363994 RepID=UPI0038057985